MVYVLLNNFPCHFFSINFDKIIEVFNEKKITVYLVKMYIVSLELHVL